MLNLAIVQELSGTATHFGKTWCYPTQQTILGRLHRHHSQTLCLRTLNRHLAALEAAGWIKRICRHQPGPKANWTFRSTLYVLLGPVWKMVKRMAKAVAHTARWSRVTSVSNNVNTTCYKSLLAPPTGPPSNNKKDSAAKFAADARKILAR